MKEGRLRQTHPAAGPAFSYRVDGAGGGGTVSIDGLPAGLEIESAAVGSGGLGRGWIRDEQGRPRAFAAGWVGDSLHLWLDGRQFIFERVSAQPSARLGGALEGEVLAPMPGRVVQVLVEDDQQVEAGETLVIMESMKMELVIEAPRAGAVKRVAVSEGSQVDRGMRLVEMEE